MLPNPTLVCEFSRTKRLPSNLTFTRASTGTYTDNNGYVRYADNNVARFDHTPSDGTSNGLLIEESRTNYFTKTSNFEDTAWNKTNTVAAKGYLAPDGTYNAVKLIDNAVNGYHYASQLITPSTTSICVSVFVKAVERSSLRIDISNASNASVASFDLAAGTTIATNASPGFPGGITSGIIPYPNGWYRVWCAGTLTAAAAITIYFDVGQNNTTFTYAGTGTSGLLIWGPQIENGLFPSSYTPSVDTYTSRASTATYFDSVDGLLKVTPTNLLTYSQDFTNAAWTKYNIVAFSSTGSLSNIAIAPDGTQTASKIVEDTTTGVHSIYSPVFQTNIGEVLTYSIYAKAGERTKCSLMCWNDGTNRAYIQTVDLLTGTGGTTGSTGLSAGTYTSKVESVGYGWYRISITFVPVVTGTAGQIEFRLSNGGDTYAGTSGYGLYVYGAQVNYGQLQTYLPTTATAVNKSTVTNGGSRANYNPYTKVNYGTLLEPAATNLLSYSEQFDNAIWTKNSVTVTANQTLAPDGTLTGDLLTDSDTTNPALIFQVSAAQPPGVYTSSWFVKQGTYTNFTVNSYYTGAGVEANAQYSFGGANGLTLDSVDAGVLNTGFQPLANGWFRVWISFNVVGTVTLNHRLWPGNRGIPSTTGNIYIWGGMLESGYSATSYIQTIASSVTRVADTGTSTAATRVAEKCYINVGPWYNPVEGALYLNTNVGNGNFPIATSFNNGTDYNNQISLYRISSTATQSTNLAFDLWSSGANQLTGMSSIAPASTSFAYAWKTNDVAFSYTGTTPITDTSVALPVGITQLEIGSRLNSLYLNGTISKLYYFPKRLPNTDLQNISGLT